MPTVNLLVRVFRPSALSDSTEFVNTVMVAPTVSGNASDQSGQATVVLVVDVSGSMAAEGKLENAKKAATVFVDQLRPTDRLAIVAFDSDAKVVVPLSAGESAGRIRSGIASMQPGGGTEMGKGIESALHLIAGSGTEGARRIIVLTDGETSDEARCRSLAKKAANDKVPVSTYGLGSEWNRELLTEIAETTRGHVGYIQGAADVSSALTGEFRDLQETALVDAEVVVVPTDGVTVRSIHRVVPDVVEYPVESASEVVARVGDISRDARTAPRFLVDLVLPPRPSGPVRAARVFLRYRAVGDSVQRQTDLTNVVVTYTVDRSQASMIDPDIKALIDQREASRMVAKAEAAVQRGDIARATTLLANARTVTQALGNAKVTTQLTDALDELTRSGGLSEEARKTILFGTRQTTKLGGD